MKLCVCGFQMAVTSDVHTNAASIRRAVDFAVAHHADILLTPEGSLSGYLHQIDAAATQAAAAELVSTASKGNLALALGTCWVGESDHKLRNALRFYSKSGEFLGQHTKTLKCTSEVDAYATDPLRVFDFDGLTVGGLICNDMWANPTCTPMPDSHLTRQLASLGARVIFHAVNGGRGGPSDWDDCTFNYHRSNLMMRAKADKLWIVTVDNCEPVKWRTSAPSGVLTPDGSWALAADPQGEHLFLHDLVI